MATVVVDGVISPVTLRLVESALAHAKAGGAQALVIQLDTPGGLERSMRAICQRLLNAEIPVIVWVGPTGARAASAGVFITMAAHVAAMAPATNIGAAHPVAVGGSIDKESMRKIENDAAAFIRTIAVERGRNADWGEKAVRQSVGSHRHPGENLLWVTKLVTTKEPIISSFAVAMLVGGGSKCRAQEKKGPTFMNHSERKCWP